MVEVQAVVVWSEVVYEQFSLLLQWLLCLDGSRGSNQDVTTMSRLHPTSMASKRASSRPVEVPRVAMEQGDRESRMRKKIVGVVQVGLHHHHQPEVLGKVMSVRIELLLKFIQGMLR